MYFKVKKVKLLYVVSYHVDQALGDGKGQGRLACFSPQGCKELDMTERLINNKSCILSR